MRTIPRALALAAAIIAAGCSDGNPFTGLDPDVQLDLAAPVAIAAADPAPGETDQILIDARRAIQDASGLYEALRNFGGTKVNGRWGFSRNVDGRGTNALRVDWTNGRRDRCVIGNSVVRVPLPAPRAGGLFVQWKQLLGRTETGGGVGAVARFTFPAGGRCVDEERTVMLGRRSANDVDGLGRVDYGWSGGSIPAPFVSVEGGSDLRIDPIGGAVFDVRAAVGRVVTQTLFLQPESAPGAGDGIVRLWADGALVLESTSASLGAGAFTGINFPGRLPLPTHQQTEYIWDLLAWAGSADPGPEDPPPVVVGSVELTPAEASLAIGATMTLDAVVKSTEGAVIEDAVVAWESSHPEVASVDGGTVTGRSAGTATIRATSGGRSGVATITVTTIPVATVAVTPAAPSVFIGRTVQLTAVTSDAEGNVLTGREIGWTSNATGVATVSGTGLVTGVAAGSATITATSEGKTGTATVTVSQVPVATVTVAPAAATLSVGDTRQLTATLRDATGGVLTGRTVTWTTNVPGVATVSTAGVVTARGAGLATITATSEGMIGISAITVSEPLPPPPPVNGTYFVSPNGSDANPGTATSPFRTIQRAANLVNPGDVVIVEDGVWTDTDGDGSVVAVDRGGTAGALVTFRSRNRWGARLDGQNGRAAQGFDLNNGVGYVRIEGFEIFGIANVGTPRGSASGVDMYDGGHDSQVVGNHIHHIGRVCTNSGNTNGQVGVYVEQPNITIEGNLIHDIGRFFPGENGCSYSGDFHGYETLDHGVYLNGGSPGADGTIIRNNVFYNTRHGWAVQFYPGSLSNVHVLNNTFAFGNPNKNFTHIVLDASISASSIVNNIFYNPEGGRTMEAVGFSGSITISNNLTSGSAMTDRSSTPSGMTMVNNRLGTNPLFVNAAGFDFRLQAGSPAIDAGISLSGVTVDFEGRLRPRGTAYDIGAYEF